MYSSRKVRTKAGFFVCVGFLLAPLPPCNVYEGNRGECAAQRADGSHAATRGAAVNHDRRHAHFTT